MASRTRTMSSRWSLPVGSAEHVFAGRMTILLAACVGLALACTPEADRFQAKVDAGAGVAPARVDLPAPVPLEGTLPPETHADGKMRIDGLLTRRGKYFGSKVMVRGFFVEKYACPEDATRCERPHAWLADSPAGGDKKLLLVNVTDEILEKFEIGQQYVFIGQYDQRSDEGFVSSTGLLMLEGAEGMELPTREESLQREEEERNKKRRR